VPDWLTWRAATELALYGERGFYHRPLGPAGDFRTSVHASPLFARAVLRLLADVDELLGRPDRLDLVDVGSGRGELLGAVGALAAPALRERLNLVAVERSARPEGLPAGIGWVCDAPAGVVGLVIANEWLDNVPVDVVERTGDGVRQVLVDPVTGAERLGGPPPSDDLDWLEAWWPLDTAERGDRAEVGRPRDEAWAAVVRRMRAGVAVAVDYAHRFGERGGGLLAAGTLTGYRAGRAVVPVPDGSCDITSHVALDACAAAGEAVGAGATLLTTQREALRALGVAGDRPPTLLAQADPGAYLDALRDAGEAAEITALGGLGDFGWLVQAVGVPLPPTLESVAGQLLVYPAGAPPRR